MARILVIDDNEDVCVVVSSILETAGHEVIVANDGARGIELQRQSPAELVITDILMPGKEGIETIRDLKQEFPELKIIAISGAGKASMATDYLLTAKELGARAVLHKPFGPGALLEAVHEQLMPPGT